ncbi:ABC transporter substrate-binding protein [Amycolatopsis bartoniae]|uniref:Sulfonate ABC transporter substrate-binding protein n=1 Tax=Amycolatopsis bartoniae TaxID=941986 RepID=A0A8H9ISX6_9PSEU|nr:ABC transporter substrate-binding protein [Amycolatopsis bartoniae]GHF43308.1 sulfonate ABC transporter substrate-binding protein [Amycolatopsis bartoniae]
MTLNVSNATRRRFLRFALGATVAAPLAASAGCSALNGSSGSSDSSSGSNSGGLEKTKLTVGILTGQQGVSEKLAEKYGYFKQQGLEVTAKMFASGPAAYPALLNGELDFAVTNYVSFYQAIAQKTLQAKVVVDVDQLGENSLVVIAKPETGIKEPKDLIGKKVSIHQSGSIAEVLLRATLKDHDVDPNQVKFQTVKFPDIPAALASGQIDAGVELEPYITQAERQHGVQPVLKIVTGSTANITSAGFVALDSFIQKNPKTVAAFQKAMVPAQTAAADRSKLLEVLPDLTGVDKDTASLLNIDTFPTSVSASQLQRVVTLMQNYGGLTAQLDASTLMVPTPQV